MLDRISEQSRSRRRWERAPSDQQAAAPLQRLAGLMGNRAFKDGFVAPQQPRALAPALQRAPDAEAIEGHAQGEAGMGTGGPSAAEAVAAGTGGSSAAQGEISGSAGASGAEHGTALNPERMISGLSTAVTTAWNQWQLAATISGVSINAVVATGGTLVGPPLEPLILATAPRATPEEIRLSTAVATGFSMAFLMWQSTVSIPALPMYPDFAAFPGPIAPPMPNIPFPLSTLGGVAAGMDGLGATIGALYGDATDTAAMAICNAIGSALQHTFQSWLATTQVTNIMGTGPVPTFAPPYSPVGPVIGGVGTMIPGGLV